MKILIMGLPGSGKTTLAKELQKQMLDIGYDVVWFNADDVRKQFNDWDFSLKGRINQSHRMKQLSENCLSEYKICDFVAPLKQMRDIFHADITIWVDTIEKGRFDDTNNIFEPPEKYDFRVTEQDAVRWADIIIHGINIPS